MSNQLIKKDTSEAYRYVYPKTFIDAIKDKETGVSLSEILSGFNMYFLSYNGDKSLTRCKVPSSLRKEGLWITYVLYDHTVVTEWYNAEAIDDDSWGSDNNWRIASNTLVGDVSISSDGYWVINNVITSTKAKGEAGNTPLLRVGSDSKLQASYNEGKLWQDISDCIIPRFRWTQGEGDTIGHIQASMDLGNTWTDLSGDITNNLKISKYIGINESLPTSGISEGTIYMKGPYYDENDTLNENPIYRMWVYAWKGNTLAWQDNGEFTSILAGVVQETGNNTAQVMSQDAVTRELTELSAETERKLADKANLSELEEFKEVVTDQVNNYKPIEIVGNVTNAADEEDLTSENDLLKLKNRSALNGKGYVVLRRNKTFSEQVNKANTIYEIRYNVNLGASNIVDITDEYKTEEGNYDYCILYYNAATIRIPANSTILLENGCFLLNTNIKRVIAEGYYVNSTASDVYAYIACQEAKRVTYYTCDNVTIPNNCTLFFNGGSIENANISFDNTSLVGEVSFKNVFAQGHIANNSINVSAFGAVGDGLTNDTRAIKSAISVCDIVSFEDKTYLVTCGRHGTFSYSKSKEGILIDRSNVSLHLNNARLVSDKINPTESNQVWRSMIYIEGAGIVSDRLHFIENISIHGGSLVGSREQFVLEQSGNKYGTKENYSLVKVLYSKNVNIIGTQLYDATGDSIYAAAVYNVLMDGIYSTRARRCAISIGLGEGYTIRNSKFEYNCMYAEYSNGNYSYNTSPHYVICSEPEPRNLGQFVEHTMSIKDITIENCSFKEENEFFVGCGVNIRIANNNVELLENNQYAIQITDSGHSELDYKISNVVVENNTCHAVVPSIMQLVFCLCRNVDKFVFSGNKIYDRFATNVESESILICDNYVDNNSAFTANTPSTGGNIIIKNNSGTFSELLFTNNNSKNVYIHNNVSTGYHQGKNDNLYIKGAGNFFIENNHIESITDALLKKSISDNNILVLKDNYIKIGKLFFDNNYAKSEIVGNTLELNNSLRKGDFASKMVVINNLFKGISQFTEDEQTTSNLVFQNNVYL